MTLPALPSRRPPWAEWNPGAAAEPWTVGIEEEVVLLDPFSLRPANKVAAVRRELPSDLVGRTAAETHACSLELRTHPAPTAAAVGGELGTLRLRLDRRL